MLGMYQETSYTLDHTLCKSLFNRFPRYDTGRSGDHTIHFFVIMLLLSWQM